MNTIKCKCHWCGKRLIRKKQSVSVKYHFCDLQCKANHQRTQKPVTKEWLYEHYVTKGLDTGQIGRMVNRDPKSVWNWLKDLGIPTRPRGGNKNYKSGPGAAGGFFGKHHSEETKKKLRERVRTDAERQKHRESKLKSGRVPYLKNGKHWLHTVGKEHHPKWKGGITPERQALYASEEWSRAARSAKKRDEYTCQRCGKRKRKGDGLSFDLHHIVSFECIPLRAVASNLVYLCEPCHYWVHGAENTEGRFILPCP